MRFFYLLPLSERQALVEYVLFSRDDCEQTLKDYLASTLGSKRTASSPGGRGQPLDGLALPRGLGRRIMAIGALGGMVKPSSGYAFTRIQADSAAIVRSLLEAGHPFDVPASPQIYRLCDALMLHVMARHGEQAEPIFSAMFKKQPYRAHLALSGRDHFAHGEPGHDGLLASVAIRAGLVRADLVLRPSSFVSSFPPCKRRIACFHIQRP